MIGKMVIAAIVTATWCVLASHVLAEECSGTIHYKNLEPKIVTKKEDGSQVMFIHNERILQSGFSDFNNNRGECVGYWTVSADGQSGSGSGHCYHASLDGDYWALEWSGDQTGGAWKIRYGTGKFKELSGGGTWTPIQVFADGWGSNSFTGKCSKAN